MVKYGIGRYNVKREGEIIGRRGFKGVVLMFLMFGAGMIFLNSDQLSKKNELTDSYSEVLNQNFISSKEEEIKFLEEEKVNGAYIYIFNMEAAVEKKPDKTEAKDDVSKQVKIVNPYTTYTYVKMIEDAEALSVRYPNIVATESIGKSVEGRDMLLVKLGRGNRKIFLNGAHHAREYISSSFLMRMTEEYAEAYEKNTKLDKYDVRKLLDDVTIYIVPMVNPDGVNLVQGGLNAAKIPEQVKKLKLVYPKLGYKGWKSNINGVDLNRNYPTGWEERLTKTTVPASLGYKGPRPGSEPEVKAMMDFVLENKDILFYVSFHSQGEKIYWTDYVNGEMNSFVKPIAKRLSNSTGYALLSSSSEDYGGGFSEWTRDTFKKPSFTIELCPYIGDIPYPDKNFDKVWNKAKYSGLLLAEEALNMK